MNHYDQITCPYCRGRKLHGNDKVFSHTDVHFRMETAYDDETEFTTAHKSINDIRRMPDSPAKEDLLRQYNRKAPFLCKEDEQYKDFWSDFNGTTEELLDNDPTIPYVRPILDPANPEHRKVLKAQRGDGSKKEDYFIYDADGMVEGIEDIHGKVTTRRVCPGCHNPLPNQYGKFPTKFISVIGVTNSGKTVFLSQLLKKISKYALSVDLVSYFTSEHEPRFIENNKVEMNTPLPRPTMAQKLAQPLYYDLSRSIGTGKEVDTIVIYDIAGENCAKAREMEKYGDFVINSDGIILLLDPGQLGLARTEIQDAGEKPAEVKTVLNTIHNTFRNVKSTEKFSIPVAVCISKADMIMDVLPKDFNDIVPIRDEFTLLPRRLFNASSYNPLQKCLCDQMHEGAGEEIHHALVHDYADFNYFAFSAIGCDVKKERGVSYPTGVPVPLRIAEPLLWLFYKFGYIGSDVPIRLPHPRPMPRTISVPKPGFFNSLMGATMERPLNEEEKQRYWYEART